MRIYRYIYFIIYRRWRKKFRDEILASWRAMLEMTFYSFINIITVCFGVVAIVFNTWPSNTSDIDFKYFVVLPVVGIIYFLHYYILNKKYNRSLIIEEFKDLDKQDKSKLNIITALYFVISFAAFIGALELYRHIYW